MTISKRLMETAKKLYKHQTGFKGVVTNSYLKKVYPGFKSSVSEHWEFLILKLLGRNRKANKHPELEKNNMQETRKPQEVKLDEIQKQNTFLKSQGLTQYGNPEFSGVTIKVKVTATNRGMLFRGSIGYNFLKECWYYTVGNQRQVFCNTLESASQGLASQYLVAV